MYEERRIPLKNGDLIRINGSEFRIESLIGEGTSCLAYRAFQVGEQSGLQDRPMILKEFYPGLATHSFDIKREKCELKVSAQTKENSEYKRRLLQFEQGYRSQWNLSCTDETMEIMVRPQTCGTFGDSYYAVTEIHAGVSMDQIVFSSLKEKLEAAMAMADMLQILHSAGYMLLDFKPENLLWIPQTKRVKLFDADSVLNFRHLDGVEPEDVRFNAKYMSPQIQLFREILESDRGEFKRKRQIYLTPAADIYSAGLMICEMLFGEIVEKESEIREEYWKTRLCETYGEELKGKEKLAGALIKIICRALKELAGYRYETAQSLFNDLNKVYHALTAERYVPRKMIAKANYSYVAYNLLEQFPLFDYSYFKGDTRVLDVAIVGNHGMRRQLLQAILSCGQMLDTRLNIRLFDSGAEQFWERFTGEDSCPELKHVVTCNLNRKMIQMDVDETIVDGPLAHLYLDTNDNERHILETLRVCHTGYVILIQEEESLNVRLARKLAKTAGKESLLIGYLNNESKKVTCSNQAVKVFAISGLRMSEAYCEEAFESRIYRMGLAVHSYYWRGSDPNADWNTIREAFKKDPYSIESSERSALHGVYKLASVGIRWDDPDASEQFYERVLKRETAEQQRNFDRLAALEHRSWTAYMILQGAKTVKSAEELKKYAYVGNNDWKDRSNPEHMKHPCLRASRPGRGLPESDWEKMTVQEIEELDPLDFWSYQIQCVLEELAEKGSALREHTWNEIHQLLKADGQEELEAVLEEMETAALGCRRKDAGAADAWNRARREFSYLYMEEKRKNPRLEEVLANLDRLMRPVLQTSEYHDFKKSDEDVILALPQILSESMNCESMQNKKEQEAVVLKDYSLQMKTVVNMEPEGDTLKEALDILVSSSLGELFQNMKWKELEDGTAELSFQLKSQAVREALRRFKEET